MTTDLIHAPWTAEQVTALNAFQHHGRMHPFTCGAEHASGQSPVLVATNGGWVCPDPQCVYRQDWAHAFMAEPAGLAAGLGVSATPSHTDLRQRIAEALLMRIKRATVSRTQPHDAFTSLLAANEYDLADAVLAVLPPPADEVDADTVANRAAQVITTMGAEIRELKHSRNRYQSVWHNARRRAAVLSAELTRRAPLPGEYAAELDRLRRLADEAQQQPETEEERADREETERDHARGDHTYCGITCEVEMPTEHLRNFVIAKGYPGTKGALDELLRRAADAAPQQEPPVHGESVAHLAGLHDDEQEQSETETLRTPAAGRAPTELRVRVLREILNRLDGSRSDGDSATQDVGASTVRAVLADILADMQPAAGEQQDGAEA